jgi:hypothetical protein
MCFLAGVPETPLPDCRDNVLVLETGDICENGAMATTVGTAHCRPLPCVVLAGVSLYAQPAPFRWLSYGVHTLHKFHIRHPSGTL